MKTKVCRYAALLKNTKRVKCVAGNEIGGWSRPLSTGRRSPESLIWRFQIESKPPLQKLQKFIYPVDALSHQICGFLIFSGLRSEKLLPVLTPSFASRSPQADRFSRLYSRHRCYSIPWSHLCDLVLVRLCFWHSFILKLSSFYICLLLVLRRFLSDVPKNLQFSIKTLQQPSCLTKPSLRKLLRRSLWRNTTNPRHAMLNWRTWWKTERKTPKQLLKPANRRFTDEERKLHF